MNRIELGAIVRFNSPHPCGDDRWEVLRTGADFRVKCLGCGRLLLMPRREFEDNLKEIISQPSSTIMQPIAAGDWQPISNPTKRPLGSEMQQTLQPAEGGIRQTAFTPDEKQKEIIYASCDARLVVEAGPGTGKTAVACARVAHLINSGIAASEILLISFTRTAVAELRERITQLCKDNRAVVGVKITTLDSYTWSLRYGFGDTSLPNVFGDYDVNIKDVLQLIREQHEGLIDFIQGIEHVIIDEAQDITGVRAQLLVDIIRNLRDDCGVTIFMDEAQAIYDFTTEDLESGESEEGNENDQRFLAFLSEYGHTFSDQSLNNIYRTNNGGLIRLFSVCRNAVLEKGIDGADRLKSVKKTIQGLATTRNENIDSKAIDGCEDTLVLYRWRSEVLLRSSFLSRDGVDHRLRMSGLPVLIHPWIGRLLSECINTQLSRIEFDQLWKERYLAHLFGSLNRDTCWQLMMRFAADRRNVHLDLTELRKLLSRARPPVEFCMSEFGSRGPILGTIHASKGREAPRVILMLPQARRPRSLDGYEEESRVLYVGATRARESLEVGDGYAYTRSARYLDVSDRVYVIQKERVAAQVEIGRNGDLNIVAHVATGQSRGIQQLLAKLAGSTLEVTAVASTESQWAYRLFVKDSTDCIGALSKQVNDDLWAIGRELQEEKHKGSLKPAEEISHLYMVGITTVVVPEDSSYPVEGVYRLSRIFLAPVIKGFPMVNYRYYRRKDQ